MGDLPVLNRPRFSTGDLVAGISVALVLIPQSLALAGIAGVPPYIGLLAAALPTIAAAFFASSPYLQTGPVAMTALLTFGALSTLAEPFSAQYVGLAALLALLVGGIRVAIGLFRLGLITYLMSRPVIIGFTIGATTLIAASQVPALLGIRPGDSGLLPEAWIALTSPSAWDVSALAFGLAAVLIIVPIRRVDPRIPGVMIAVAAALVVSSMTGFEGDIVGKIPSVFPGFSFDFPWDQAPNLVVPGLVIALVGFIEAAAISRVFAAQDRSRWDANREFIGQGVANLASGVSGGFPVGGSFSRSSVNREAGARTRWSGAITGVVVLAFLPVAGILEPLPTSVLAAIVIVAVARLINPREILPIWRQSRLQGLVALFTLVATLLLSPRIDIAVLLGIGLAVAIHLGRELRLDVEFTVTKETLTMAPKGVIYFGSTPRLIDALLSNLVEHPDLSRMVIDLAGVGRIDYTGGDALRTIIEDSQVAGLEVEVANTPAHAVRIISAVLSATESQQRTD